MLIERRPPPKTAWRMPDNPKPKLKMSLVPVFRVRYLDLEAYIKLVFGFEFDLFVCLGCVAGAYPEYMVTGKLVNDAMERQAIQIKNGLRTKNLNLILNVLAAEGYVHCGRYIIDTTPPINLTEVYRSMLESGLSPDSDECRRFCEEHQRDDVFIERAKILNDAAYEDQGRGQ